MTKYIFVTGGVVSSVGKGIVTASLGRILFGPLAGSMVQAAGWEGFFVLTFVAALPGIALVWVMRDNIAAVERAYAPAQVQA